MKTVENILAEVFGYLVSDQTDTANRYRTNRLCPFNNKVPNCTKDKAKDPLGVCSIYHNEQPVITCPIRFRQEWMIAEHAASFFFREGMRWTSLTEIRLNDANGENAGSIDIVLVSYDQNGKIIDFGALEIQAVYISGNVRDVFDYYMEDPQSRVSAEWLSRPCPDYLSSSRKRLVPQLLYKGGILHSWGKKIAIALSKSFFDTLPTMIKVSREKAHIAWFVYDLKLRQSPDHGHQRYYLTKVDEVFTEFEPAMRLMTMPSPGSVEDFVKSLQEKLDEQIEIPPTNQTIENPF
jgi:hypothetical protein